MELDVDLIDVTEEASRVVPRPEGWRVGVSQQVWDRWVARPNRATGEKDEEDRLINLLCFLWQGLSRAKGWSDTWCGYGFWVVEAVNDQPAEALALSKLRAFPSTYLTAVAMIDPGGFPCLGVFTREESPCPWISGSH